MAAAWVCPWLAFGSQGKRSTWWKWKGPKDSFSSCILLQCRGMLVRVRSPSGLAKDGKYEGEKSRQKLRAENKQRMRVNPRAWGSRWRENTNKEVGRSIGTDQEKKIKTSRFSYFYKPPWHEYRWNTGQQCLSSEMYWRFSQSRGFRESIDDGVTVMTVNGQQSTWAMAWLPKDRNYGANLKMFIFDSGFVFAP